SCTRPSAAAGWPTSRRAECRCSAKRNAAPRGGVFFGGMSFAVLASPSTGMKPAGGLCAALFDHVGVGILGGVAHRQREARHLGARVVDAQLALVDHRLAEAVEHVELAALGLGVVGGGVGAGGLAAFQVGVEGGLAVALAQHTLHHVGRQHVGAGVVAAEALGVEEAHI